MALVGWAGGVARLRPTSTRWWVPERHGSGHREFRVTRHSEAEYAPVVPENSDRIRIVIAKPGLDGHDRGAKVIARALRDAGMEVVYTGLHQTPEQIVQTVIQEDADAVGLSVLSGAHMTLFRRISELLAQNEVDDVLLFGGGIVPEADIPELEAMGVRKIFTPGAAEMDDIVTWVRENVATTAS